MTQKSFENCRLLRFWLELASTFLSLFYEKNTANGKEVCQDDRVQVCLLSYLLKELLIFSLPVDFRLRNCVLR